MNLTLKIYNTNYGRVESHLFKNDICINSSAFTMANTIHRPGTVFNKMLVDYVIARMQVLIHQNNIHNVISLVQIDPQDTHGQTTQVQLLPAKLSS